MLQVLHWTKLLLLFNMRKLIYKILFLLFCFSLCSCNKNSDIKNDLFLGEIRAQLNTVYTINCVVEPSNHTEDVVWSSNYPGYVDIVKSTNTYCQIKRVSNYVNGIGNYVTITASINNLKAYCRVYEDTSGFSTDYLRIGIEPCDGSDGCQGAINVYIDYLYELDGKSIYFDQVGAYGSYSDGHNEVLDNFIWNEQNIYPVWFAHIDHYDLIDSLPNSITFDESLISGIYIGGIATFNSTSYYFEFDYF